MPPWFLNRADSANILMLYGLNCVQNTHTKMNETQRNYIIKRDNVWNELQQLSNPMRLYQFAIKAVKDFEQIDEDDGKESDNFTIYAIVEYACKHNRGDILQHMWPRGQTCDVLDGMLLDSDALGLNTLDLAIKYERMDIVRFFLDRYDYPEIRNRQQYMIRPNAGVNTNHLTGTDADVIAVWAFYERQFELFHMITTRMVESNDLDVSSMFCDDLIHIYTTRRAMDDDLNILDRLYNQIVEVISKNDSFSNEHCFVQIKSFKHASTELYNRVIRPKMLEAIDGSINVRDLQMLITDFLHPVQLPVSRKRKSTDEE
jgi:hypothetical protein